MKLHSSEGAVIADFVGRMQFAALARGFLASGNAGALRLLARRLGLRGEA